MSVHFDSKTVGGIAKVSAIPEAVRSALMLLFMSAVRLHVQVHVAIKQDGAKELFLDTRDLIINSVTEDSTGKDLAFKFAEEHKARCPMTC